MATEPHCFQHSIPGQPGREEHSSGCVTLGFAKLTHRVPASSQQFPERDLPAGIRLALQLQLTGVQIPGGLGAHRTLGVRSRAREPPLLMEHSTTSFTTLLLSWAQTVPTTPGEWAVIKRRVRAARQILFWSQLCFCTSLSLGAGWCLSPVTAWLQHAI